MKVKPADRTFSVEEYYFSTKLKLIEEMRNTGADVISLGIGSPDMAPSENTISRLIDEVKKPNVHGYQSYNGVPALRIAFAEWYNKYFSVKLDPVSEILPLIGSKEGIMHITLAFINPGDEVLIPDPGYPTYNSVTKLAGGIVKTYDLAEEDNWLPNFNMIEEQDLSKVKLMWANYPNMPTGTKGSRVLFERLVSFGHKHNILICNDNPYSFILNEDYQSILAIDGAYDIALELNSLSKSHNMAGWRIGMVAGNKNYIQTILKVKSNMDSGILLPLQLAAAEALGNSERWYKELNSVYLRRRIIAGEILEALGCKYNPEQSGLFLWAKIPESAESSTGFTDNLLNKVHLFITPGIIFGKNGEWFVRISLCANEDTLLKAKERAIEFSKL